MACCDAEADALVHAKGGLVKISALAIFIIFLLVLGVAAVAGQKDSDRSKMFVNGYASANAQFQRENAEFNSKVNKKIRAEERAEKRSAEMIANTEKANDKGEGQFKVKF